MNRKLKRISAFFLSLILIMNMGTVSFAAENTGELTVENIHTESTYEVTEASDDPVYLYSNLTLQPGIDETQMNFCWYSDSTVTDCCVQIALKSDMTGTDFPSSVTSFTGTVAVPTNNTINKSNKVTVTGLVPSTEYIYRVGDGTSFSTPNTFETQNSSSYNAILVGDPQIGSTDLVTDTAGWLDTLDKALGSFPNSSFILSAGDQVNVKTSEDEYTGFFSSSKLSSTPLAPTIGNHDNGSLYKYHYNSPNESIDYGTTDAGGDYWFKYGNTLYMVLNSNNKSATSHDAFIGNTIADAGDNIQWKFVMFHHSIYSSAAHSEDSDILSRRSDLYPIFDKYDIDVVLMGHDHDYARSYQMLGDTVQRNQTVDDEGRVVNPSGTVYITANSASGSKYYELMSQDHGYEACRWQGHVPSYSNIAVTNDTFTITTYRTDNEDVIDTYSIYKDNVLKAKKPESEQKVNVGDSTEIAAADIAEGGDGNELTITAITTDPNSSVATASLNGGKITITGIATGSTSLTVRVSDGTDEIEVGVPIEAIDKHDLYFGMDIKSGEFKNESGSDVSDSAYSTSGVGGYTFEKDDDINQNVLCGPESGNLVINGLNLKPLNNQFTMEAYVKIPNELSLSAPGSLTAYDVFQFDRQNINVVGVTGATYFGAGRCTNGGDADVYVGKTLPTDQWIHLLCTAKEGKQTLYVNGEEFSSDVYTDLNLTSSYQDELVLGGSSAGRSGLIKYAYLRIYSDFIEDEVDAQNMYQEIKNSFPEDLTVATPEIIGITPPVTGAVPTETIADTTEYSAAITWDPADETFAVDKSYTATITLTPKAGYTLNGVTENFFTVDGATSVSNVADSGVITAVFPATKAEAVKTIAVGNQSGTIIQGTTTSVTFNVVLTNIVDDSEVTVDWCDVNEDSVSEPNGIHATGTNVNSNSSIITMTAYDSAEAGVYYFKVTSDGITSDVAELTITLDEPVKLIMVGVQNGTLMQGTTTPVTFNVVLTNIEDDSEVTVNWCDADGDSMAEPNGIHAIGTDVESNHSIITVMANESAVAGIYYFVVTSDGVSSGVVALTVWSEHDPVKTYFVTFLNWDGSVLKNEIVNEGDGATAPENPNRAGYKFIGWNIEFSNVTSDITVVAEFKKNSNSSSDDGESSSGGSESSSSSNATNTTEKTAPEYQASVLGLGEEDTKRPVNFDTKTGGAMVDMSADMSDVFTGRGTSKIEIPAIPGAITYSLEVQASALSGEEKKDTVTFSTELGSVMIPNDMLKNNLGLRDEKAVITIGESNKDNLSDEVKTAVGNRPLVQITLNIDGVQTEWNNPYSLVIVSIPYTPTAVELENSESIVVWYIDGSGNAVSVPNGHYNSATGTVIFATTHFSEYAVVFNKVNFNDVEADAWYSKAVNFITARGIASGTGNGSFSPEAKLTRAEFIVMMMKAYDIAPDTSFNDNFEDAGNAYYTAYLAKAKTLGIAEGVGDNMFAPNNHITRQEMFTLMYNALKAIDRLPEGNSEKQMTAFSDAGEIASWANDAMTLMVESEIISGNNGKLYPAGTTTRAEMAQVLYNLISK